MLWIVCTIEDEMLHLFDKIHTLQHVCSAEKKEIEGLTNIRADRSFHRVIGLLPLI
jgi:hypothetical protein